MKVVPMLFNTEMVKAIIDGRKTVTRRLVTPQPQDSGEGYHLWPSKKLETMVRVSDIEHMPAYQEAYHLDIIKESCPVANIGDLIYVRETIYGLFSIQPESDTYEFYKRLTRDIKYVADGGDLPKTTRHCKAWKTVPSIHMPRWASRITLRVTDIRIERVQDITETQAKNEGVSRNVWFKPHGSIEDDWLNDGDLKSKYKTSFANIWESIHKNWDENPYVWVIEFDVVMMNVDEYINTNKLQ